jgi:DUF1365 family protein|tara:strand:+ start:1600 stop:1794 length:195 start_codon:yes stop_codon:yes gene_type:complete
MSKMGQFVFECQEIAESNSHESKESVIAEVEQTFVGERKYLVPMAVDSAVGYWEEIQSDLRMYL